MRRRTYVLCFACALASSTSAFADVGSGYTLFGDAEYISPSHSSNRAVKLDANDPSEFGGIDFAVTAEFTLADLDSLSTNYMFPIGSTCGGGSPRFQIKVDHDRNPATADRSIFIYIGPTRSYAGCRSGIWTSTTNLVDPADLGDASQLGGDAYQTWASVKIAYGKVPVTGIELVTDTVAGLRTVLVDNVHIDGTVESFEFTSKESCKKGGYRKFSFPPGPFENERQCVSSFGRRK